MMAMSDYMQTNIGFTVDRAYALYKPNVCAVEINDDISYAYYTESKQWNPRKICGKPTFVKYKCCTGYYRVSGRPECTGVKPLINLIETTRRVGSTKFAKLIESSRFAEELRNGSPLMLFVPSNDAFENYLKIKGISQKWLHDGNRYINLIANHIIDRRVLSSQWQMNLLIPSRLQGNALRINKFSNRMETVNCRRIIRKDQIATNEVVHVIDGVLDLALAQNSDIIELATRDGRFGIFTKALENSELGKRIRFSGIPCTIFSPTDDAFRNIPEKQLTDMLENPNALNALIAHHIVTHSVLNDATLVKSDILNKAGVAHEINSVLLPDHCSPSYRRQHDDFMRKVCV
ncbi:Transforming growth factor-beta-induced protein ig-h3 [Anthophora plagiata]